jgi:hypothetical protein
MMKPSAGQWVADVRGSGVRKCSACGVAGPSRFALQTAEAQQLLVVNVDGRAAVPVALPEIIPLANGFRLEAVVQWVGTGHVIARVRETAYLESWRDFDDLAVADTKMVPPWGCPRGMQKGPFKLAFYVAKGAVGAEEAEPLDDPADDTDVL